MPRLQAPLLGQDGNGHAQLEAAPNRRVIGALCVQRGMSSVQLAQEVGIGIKTAWMLVRRLKAAAAHEGGLIADNPNPELP